MPAEWLHRCAYSWGGLTEDPFSSQVVENLIFGTGESNSVMTRYEKAWQALVCREGDRLKRSIGNAGGGMLHVNTNRGEYPIRFGSVADIRQPLKSKDTKEELPHWLCYALDYKLLQNNPVVPLGNQRLFKTVFYPWQRGFFTKFEQTLDEVVLEQVYETWEKNKSFESNNRRAPSGSFDEFEIESKDLKKLKTEGMNNKGMNDTVSFSHDADGQDQILSNGQSFSGSHSQNLVAMPLIVPDNEKLWSIKTTRDAVADTELIEEAVEENVQENEEADTSKELTNINDSIAAETSAVIPEPERLMSGEATPDMRAIWDAVHAPGPTVVDGLFLSNARIVEERSDPSYDGEVKDFKINNGNNNVLSYDTKWAAAGEPEIINKYENEARSRDSEVLEVDDELILLPQVDPLPEPTYDRIENSETRTIQTLPETKVKNQLSTEQVFSELDPKPHQEPKPTAYRHHQERQQRSHRAHESSSTVTRVSPGMFVIQADFLLFGKHKVELESLQNAAHTGVQHYRITLPTELSLGVFMPSFAGSDLDAIAMRDTTVTYRSRGRRAGLMLTTTITLSGMLQPVNTLLRDVFGQTTPHIDVTTFLSSSPLPHECLTRIPEPLGFTMRGELPEINVPDLFGVLTVTHIGVDVMGRRLGSAGGYELGYAFFGRGHVGTATRVEWRINKFGQHWSISIYTESSNWKNVAGIDGVDVSDKLSAFPPTSFLCFKSVSKLPSLHESGRGYMK